MRRPPEKLAVVSAILLCFCCGRVAAQFPPAPGTGPGLAETIEAIDSARATTRILYITAHPDDESAAVLTYLARGLHADVALLSLTRGEGGQNALGPEQAPQLGLIRTQELLAATRGYGVKLFYTRAQDFGFSKTPEETEKMWGDQVLEDMVRVIRIFRPNVVINNFGGVHYGHGHHQTAGLLTPKAVQLAADEHAFSGHLEGELPPWNGEDGRSISILDIDRGGEKKDAYLLPVDDVSPLWGMTYRQMGLNAFANHRTQGIPAFLGSSFLRRPMGLVPEDGSKFDPRALAVALRDLSPGCKAFEEADDKLSAARTAAQNLDWRSAISLLALAANSASQWQEKCPWHLTTSLAQEYAVADRNRSLARMEKALALAAGVEVTAEADRGELVAGESFTATEQARCRTEAGCAMGETKLLFNGSFQETKREGEPAKSVKFTVAVSPAGVPVESGHANPLNDLLPGARRKVANNLDTLLPEPRPLVSVSQEVIIGGYKLLFTQPVTHLQVASTRVDRVPLRLVPAYTLTVEPRQTIQVASQPGKAIDVFLRVHSYAEKPAMISAGLQVPQGWRASSPLLLDFERSGDKYVRLSATPAAGQLAPGKYVVNAYAKRGEEKFSKSLEPLPSLPTQVWEEPAQTVVHVFDISVPQSLRVGYISAESEPIPEALERVGIKVEMLDAAALAFRDLSNLDAIVVGIRAYELRPDLPGANQRLLDYARNGGTLLVQYQRDFAWDKFQYAPYPAKIDSGGPSAPLPRITDETAAVKFLRPNDALLNRPNKIGESDFEGWVQERALYLWTQFDERYMPLLAMHDPGEVDQNGSLVYARYGKGTYIYTGLAFFRQLPEGVAGAYRLFVNLLSASRYPE